MRTSRAFSGPWTPSLWMRVVRFVRRVPKHPLRILGNDYPEHWKEFYMCQDCFREEPVTLKHMTEKP